MADALTLIHLLSRRAVDADDARVLLHEITREALQTVDADRAFIALANDDTGELNLIATAGVGWTDERRALRLKIVASPKERKWPAEQYDSFRHHLSSRRNGETLYHGQC